MGDPKTDLVRSWLVKARNDLAAAAKLGRSPDVYLDVAVYHAQQPAEKAIKAFLVYADQPVGKTHDLEALFPMAAAIEPRLAPWIEVADALTPYATLYRYPGETVDPGTDEFAEAVRIAARVYGEIPRTPAHGSPSGRQVNPSSSPRSSTAWQPMNSTSDKRSLRGVQALRCCGRRSGPMGPSRKIPSLGGGCAWGGYDPGHVPLDGSQEVRG